MTPLPPGSISSDPLCLRYVIYDQMLCITHDRAGAVTVKPANPNNTEVGAVTAPALRMGKLRHREVRWLAGRQRSQGPSFHAVGRCFQSLRGSCPPEILGLSESLLWSVRHGAVPVPEAHSWASSSHSGSNPQQMLSGSVGRIRASGWSCPCPWGMRHLHRPHHDRGMDTPRHLRIPLLDSDATAVTPRVQHLPSHSGPAQPWGRGSTCPRPPSALTDLSTFTGPPHKYVPRADRTPLCH